MRVSTVRRQPQLRKVEGHDDFKVFGEYHANNSVTLAHGDCRAFLKTIPIGSARLVVTSPPYNLGKEYERKQTLQHYLSEQRPIIEESARILASNGSLCWQVGNFVERGEIVPLDIALFPLFASAGLRMRNRVVWHFEHGLHCSRRFSGRYEVIMWFTKSDDYIFNVDPIRVPQKYPGKRYFKGPKAGQLSCNPKGKNPGDLWIIPNVKHNHVEKTEHPCQFPVELVERLVLSMTERGDLIVDPFMGVGSSAVASIRHGRRAAGAEICKRYWEQSVVRVWEEHRGELRTRPMAKPVYVPSGREKVARSPILFAETIA